MDTAYRSYLSINHKPKAVPYGGDGRIREDGDANYGFKDLKGKPSLLVTIPELKCDPALMALVEAINGNQTGLFSVGCVSGPVSDEKGFRHSGYVEFAMTSNSGVADARNYFPLFFHFDRLAHENSFAYKVDLHWELQPAHFLERKIDGFTCTIFVNTYYYPTKTEADEAWSYTLNALAGFLQGVPQQGSQSLY